MKKISKTVLIATLTFLSATFSFQRSARADLFGGDVIVLSQILIQAVDQVFKLQGILGKASETVGLLQEMNRGVKEVLKLAETAHIKLPPSVYEKANTIDQASIEAQRVFGTLTARVPLHTKTQYRSGVEALHISQDAFEYSTFLDGQGEKVKSAAIFASPSAAARLTAETLGVLLHSNSHANRIQAKALEISSSARLEESIKENAKFESLMNTHQKIEDDMRASSFSGLNGLGY